MALRGSRPAAVRRAVLAAVVVGGLAGCNASIPTTSASGTGAPRAPASGPRHTAAQTAAPSPAASALPVTHNPRTIAARATVPVLCYHQVRDWTGADSGGDRSITTPVATFEAQMTYLDRHGWQPISPEQLYAHVTRGAPLPPKPVLLTFDDGHRSQFTNAARILRKHGFTGTFFLMTVSLGHRPWMTKSDVRTLDRMGMTIGSHTWDHSSIAGYHGKDWTAQLDDPAKELAQIVGHPIRWFAYPYGVWTRSSLPHVAAAGYAAAWQLRGKPMDPRRPLLTLRRILAVGPWSTAVFANALRER